MSDIAVKVEHLSKMYRLGVINNGTLFRDIQTWFALKRGREDPHSVIGSDKYKGDKDHFWALKDISFDIKQGDRVGIIGRNGAGKSTLLKLLSRISSPTEGVIKIKGKVASLLEVGTGFHGELTGRENIYLNGAILGMKVKRIDEKIDEIIEFSGIEHHIDTPVKRYSSGMYVRLAFAVAAHLDSDILIADEVLAVGDAEFQKKALGKMQDLSTGEGRTVFFVSHNMGAVRNLCNSGILLVNGKIVKSSNDINELTFEYINDFCYNSSENRISVWKNTGNIHNPLFTPKSLEILEENGQGIIGALSADKNYKIKFVFETEEFNQGLVFFLALCSIDGTLLFRANPLEYLKDYHPTLGINTLYCVIPANLLNIGEYTLSLGCGIHAKQVLYDSDIGEISLLLKINSRTTINPYGNYKSLISPKIKWITE